MKDTTVIRNISLKDFLSDIWTKAELTEADKLFIVHAVSVPHEAELVVSSPDTDVLSICIHTCQFLQSSSLERAG